MNIEEKIASLFPTPTVFHLTCALKRPCVRMSIWSMVNSGGGLGPCRTSSRPCV